jgi:hypothetical protein
LVIPFQVTGIRLSSAVTVVAASPHNFAFLVFEPHSSQLSSSTLSP